jgi:hypothetical protein
VRVLGANGAPLPGRTVHLVSLRALNPRFAALPTAAGDAPVLAMDAIAAFSTLKPGSAAANSGIVRLNETGELLDFLCSVLVASAHVLGCVLCCAAAGVAVRTNNQSIADFSGLRLVGNNAKDIALVFFCQGRQLLWSGGSGSSGVLSLLVPSAFDLSALRATTLVRSPNSPGLWICAWQERLFRWLAALWLLWLPSPTRASLPHRRCFPSTSLKVRINLLQSLHGPSCWFSSHVLPLRV